MKASGADRDGRHTSSVTVGLYVSGHGFGHSVRCAQVAQALSDRGARVIVRTDAPRFLFPARVEYAAPDSRIDVGVAQHDGLDLDIDATRDAWRAFAASLPAAAEREAAWLHECGVDVVLADVPPLAFLAADRAGIPSLALANFGWDWIYAIWPGFEPIVGSIQRAYARADLLLRLPLSSTAVDAFAAFARIEDVPLIGRRAGQPRELVRDGLRLSNEAYVVLLSFGGFDAHGLDTRALGDLQDYVFVATPPIALDRAACPSNFVVLAERPADYLSLLAACDAVVTKPGYGIVADCLANRVPILYTDRGPFREYDVLASALEDEDFAQAQYAPRADVLAGRVGPYLDMLRRTRARWADVPINGAAVVADRVLHQAGGAAEPHDIVKLQ